MHVGKLLDKLVVVVFVRISVMVRRRGKKSQTRERLRHGRRTASRVERLGRVAAMRCGRQGNAGRRLLNPIFLPSSHLVPSYIHRPAHGLPCSLVPAMEGKTEWPQSLKRVKREQNTVKDCPADRMSPLLPHVFRAETLPIASLRVALTQIGRSFPRSCAPSSSMLFRQERSIPRIGQQ